MMKPNFIVMGAAKSGTTSLDGYLKQHPDIFLPEVKECRYFSNVKDKNINPFTKQSHAKIISTPQEYYSLYQSAYSKAIGDISPDYLYYYEESIKNIKSELGNDVRIIIILRNPVQRAYSNYMHLVRDDLTNVDFDVIIDLEDTWDLNTWYGFNIIKSGYYYEAINDVFENFKNVKVIIFEDFISNPQSSLKEICEFLGVDNHFEFKETEFKNKTGTPKNRLLNYLIKNNFPLKGVIKKIVLLCFGKAKVKRRLNKLKENNLVKPELSKSIEQQLYKKYQDDIVQLEKLLDKDLSIWK